MGKYVEPKVEVIENFGLDVLCTSQVSMGEDGVGVGADWGYRDDFE